MFCISVVAHISPTLQSATDRQFNKTESASKALWVDG